MLGFAVKYRGVLLDLEDNTYLTVEWYSTLFNEAELFRGSYSYAIGLKLTDKNKAALGLPHLLENRASRKSIEVSLLLFGHTWKNAMLDYTIKGSTLSGNLLIDNAIVADSLKNLTLPDMFSYYDGESKAYQGIEIGQNQAQKLQYLNNTATNAPGVYPMAWPFFKNFGWSGEFSSSDFKNPINLYNYTTSNYNLDNNGYFYCPMFYMHWIINKMCDKLGFKAVGSFMDNKEVSRWVVFNNSYYTDNEILKNDFKVYPSRHLPDISIGEFFKILRNDMRLGIYFDSMMKVVTLEMPDVQLGQSKYIDLGNMIEKNSLNIKNSDPKRYVVKGLEDESEKLSVCFERIKSLAIGEGDKTTPVELKMGAPMMNSIIYHGDNIYSNRFPIVEQLANLHDEKYIETEAYNDIGVINKNKTGFRLLSFRGLQPYGQANPGWYFPYATSDNRNSKDEIEQSYIATDPFNEQGWLRKECASFYRMLHMQEAVEYDMYIPINKFSELHPLSKSRIVGRSGGMLSVFFDRITFEPSKRNSQLFAKIKGYGMSASYALMDSHVDFKINEKEIPTEMIYVSTSMQPTRTEDHGNNYRTFFGKVFFEFWSDKYMQRRQKVSGLRLDFVIELILKFAMVNQEINNVQERTVYTGSNVESLLTDEEFAYWSNGPMMKYSSKVYSVQNDENNYVPIE